MSVKQDKNRTWLGLRQRIVTVWGCDASTRTDKPFLVPGRCDSNGHAVAIYTASVSAAEASAPAQTFCTLLHPQATVCYALVTRLNTKESPCTLYDGVNLDVRHRMCGSRVDT